MREEMENVTKNELQCEIVQDLLPLYHDGVINTVTKQAIEEHLEGCEACTKEYQGVCEEFPKEVVDEKTTKSGFDTMKKRLKKQQVIRTTLIAIAACVVVILIGYVLLYVPIVPVDDDAFEVQAAYKVEDGDKTVLFLLYKEPNYAGTMSYRMQSQKNADESVIHANMKRTVFTSMDQYDNGAIYYEIIEIDSDTERVSFAGEIIWSEDEKGTEEVPEFVPLLVDLDKCAGEYSIGTNHESIGVDYYNEGRYIYWDFEGNVVREGYFEDAPSQYFEGTVLRVDEDYMLIQPFSRYWIADISNVIYVSMNTEEGQLPKDFKSVEIGEQVGVHFYGALTEEPDYTIERVTNIEMDVNNK